jgi:hypothetical protein
MHGNDVAAFDAQPAWRKPAAPGFFGKQQLPGDDHPLILRETPGWLKARERAGGGTRRVL